MKVCLPCRIGVIMDLINMSEWEIMVDIHAKHALWIIQNRKNPRLSSRESDIITRIAVYVNESFWCWYVEIGVDYQYIHCRLNLTCSWTCAARKILPAVGIGVYFLYYNILLPYHQVYFLSYRSSTWGSKSPLLILVLHSANNVK